MVPVGACIRTQGGITFHEPESRLEDVPVIIDVPSAIAASPIASAAGLSGIPGTGGSRSSRPAERPVCTTRKPSASVVLCEPAARNLSSTRLRCFGFTAADEQASPRVIAAAIPHVAATIRSP